MPRVLFYSDPHLGLSRKANFTPDSNRRRGEYVRDGLLTKIKDFEGTRICLGDFFDQQSNPEEVILSTVPIAEQTDLIMAGNHDIPNRKDKESSLKLLQELYKDRILIDATGEGFTTQLGLTYLCFAPHALSQAEYDEMISALERQAAQQSGVYRVLCLHCNYNLPEAFLNEHTLNLTQERATELLSTFHHILIGHVHNPSDHFEGRLKLIGSVYPTAFDNMTDKRMLAYDTDTGEFTDTWIWHSDKGLYRGPVSQLQEAPHAQYYDLEDDLPPGDAQRLVIRLFEGGAFGVRLGRTEKENKTMEDLSSVQLEKLTDTIEKELKKKRPHLLPLWEELTQC